MQEVLTEVIINFPKATFKEINPFIDLFHTCDKTDKTISFSPNQATSLPKVSLRFSTEISKPTAIFLSGQNDLARVVLENTTGKEWDSKFQYSKISLGMLAERLSNNQIMFQYYDHLGINIPSVGAENQLLEDLCKILAKVSLLHSFPKNSDWKFIIPGSLQEIAEGKLDYSIERRPKFELVNFTTCSTPIVQIDLATNARYELIKDLFPEAIHDDNLRNIWIYLENSTDADICLVLNEVGSGWTSFFADSLIR